MADDATSAGATDERRQRRTAYAYALQRIVLTGPAYATLRQQLNQLTTSTDPDDDLALHVEGLRALMSAIDANSILAAIQAT